MVVSSHDFTSVEDPETRDWGRFQILNAHDMTITGCKYVDVFLSAGLSEHRSHHVFPYQRSGFANIATTPLLERAARAHGIAWDAPKGLFSAILPAVVASYVWAPVQDPIVRKPIFKNFADEHLNLAVYKCCAGYVLAGLLGIGSI